MMDATAANDAEIVLLRALEQNESASTADLAALHARCLPESALTLLGGSGLEKAYRFMARSESEEVFLALGSAGQVLGGAVVSYAPASAARRLALHPSLAPYLALGWGRRLWRSFGPGRASPAGAGSVAAKASGPEVLSLFVAPELRRSGLGRRLLATSVEAVRKARLTSLSVFAPAATPETLAFYQALGFADKGAAAFRGQSLRLLEIGRAHV